MSTNEQTPLSQPTSAVRNMLGKEQVLQDLGTPSRRRDLKERLESRHVRSRSGSPEPRRHQSESPRKKGTERKTVFKRLEKGVFHRLGDKGKAYPRTRTIQGVGHTTVAAETPKAVTRVLAQKKQNLPLKNGVQKAGEGCLPQARRQGEEHVLILERFKASVIP
ncbi:hypothetical protein Tco_1178822 [Tanacetum coccineum]